MSNKDKYLFVHPESEWGSNFRFRGEAPLGYEFGGLFPPHNLLVFRRIPLWRRCLGER